MKTVSLENSPTKRKISSYIILILLPFIILFALELFLRIAGVGKDIPLFIESRQFQSYLQPNPNIIQRYFPNVELAPDVSPDSEYFKKDKPKNSFRIVIQGGSTAAGFPYGRWGSIKGMLDQRFKRLYPNKNIEIINTAMSAVNSYTLLDFVDEIIQQQPDLVLIYAGHNEYLGIMGVGSAFASQGGRAATLMSLKFKSFRLYQLIEKIFYSSKTPSKSQKDILNTRTLMSQIAKEKNIPFKSKMYQDGVEQFKGNLSLILSKYKKHNIPVMISTLVSNERDQPPFSSVQSNDWEDFRSSLINHATVGNLQNLKKKLEHNPLAETAYKISLILSYKEQHIDAKIYFKKARDLDLLRFRAPTEFNLIISDVAETYDMKVVDANSYFIKNSFNGIIGNELILEHLHPNTLGYFYLAESFGDAIINNNYLGPISTNYSRLDAIKDIPISKNDKYYAAFKIKNLISAYPFTNNPYKVSLPKSENLEAIALKKRLKGESWLSLQQQLLVQYQKRKDFTEAAKIASLLSDAIPEQHKTAYIAGQLYFKVKDFSLALYYHKRASSIEPNNNSYRLAIAQDFYVLEQFSESLIELEEILKLEPEHKSALFFIKKIKKQIQGN